MADCAEMASMIPDRGVEAPAHSSDRQGACPDMTLECLVVMNCLPPLALTDTGAAELAERPEVRTYQLARTSGLESEAVRPESPPPQAVLTI